MDLHKLNPFVGRMEHGDPSRQLPSHEHTESLVVNDQLPSVLLLIFQCTKSVLAAIQVIFTLHAFLRMILRSPFLSEKNILSSAHQQANENLGFCQSHFEALN